MASAPPSIRADDLDTNLSDSLSDLGYIIFALSNIYQRYARS